METACHSSSERRGRQSVELKFVIAIGTERERPNAFGRGVVIDYVCSEHDILNMANSGKPSAQNKLGFMLIV